MKISVAMCTYNGADFLSEQLQSFAAQTWLPDELIVCDDHSTDKTIEILNFFKKRASFPINIYINNSNLGSTKNFEKAVSLCTGDIIFLSDQDDVWLPEKIEFMLAEFEQSPEVGLVFTDSALVNEKLETLNLNFSDVKLPRSIKEQLKGEKLFALLLNGGIVSGNATAFRSNLRSFILPFPNINGSIHDEWIGIVAAIFSKIVFLDKSLLKYRQHGQQQLGITKKTSIGRPEGLSRSEVYAEVVRSYENRRNVCPRVRELLKLYLKINADTLNSKKKHDTMLDQLNSYDKKLENAIKHNKVRAKMPTRRLKRSTLIFKEMINGNYRNYSRGLRSVVLDIFESIQK